MNCSPPLECTRNRLGPEVRHLRVIGEERALCGAGDQDPAGAGTFSSLLKWVTHAKCRRLAEASGPNEHQLDDDPKTVNALLAAELLPREESAW